MRKITLFILILIIFIGFTFAANRVSVGDTVVQQRIWSPYSSNNCAQNTGFAYYEGQRFRIYDKFTSSLGSATYEFLDNTRINIFNTYNTNPYGNDLYSVGDSTGSCLSNGLLPRVEFISDGLPGSDLYGSSYNFRTDTILQQEKPDNWTYFLKPNSHSDRDSKALQVVFQIHRRQIKTWSTFGLGLDTYTTNYRINPDGNGYSVSKQIKNITYYDEDDVENECLNYYVAKCGDGVIDNLSRNDGSDGDEGILVNGQIIPWAFPVDNVQNEECDGNYKFENGQIVPLGEDETCGEPGTESACRIINITPPQEDPTCIFNGPQCGIEANGNNIFTATLSGLSNGTQIRLMVSSGSQDFVVWNGTFTNDGDYNANFNLNTIIQGGVPPVPSNPLSFYWEYYDGNLWQQIPDATDPDNNCSAVVPVRPSCESFNINGLNEYTGSVNDTLNFSCNGLYGVSASIYMINGPTWFGIYNSNNNNEILSRINTYNYLFNLFVIPTNAGLGTYQVTCEINPIDTIPDSCNLANTCTATLNIVEHSCDNDGVLEDGEQCDDGNTNNGDGCNSQCELETPRCSGTINGVSFSSITLMGYSPFYVNFVIDGYYGIGLLPSSNDNILLDLYFFSGSVNNPTTGSYYNTYQNLIYTTGHIYYDTGIANYGFRLTNSISPIAQGLEKRPSVRCTGQINILQQPTIHITKLQRNETQNLPSDGSYTGNIVYYRSGDIIYYQLVVGNSGDNTTNQDINISDYFGTGINLTNRRSGVDCSSNISSLNGDIVGGWTMIELAGQSTCTIYLSGIINNDDYSQGELSGVCQTPRINTGILSYNNIFSTGVVYGDYFPILQDDIIINKSFSAETGMLGGQIDFTITVTNNGQRNLYGLVFNDQLPSSLSGNGSFGNNLTRDIGTLLVGQSINHTRTVDILDNANLSGTYIYNTGVLTDICLGTFTGSDSFLVINQLPEITIEKLQRNWTYCQNVQLGIVDGDPNVACSFTGNDILVYDQGDILEYQLVVGNNSDITGDIHIEDTTTFGLQITDQSSQGFDAIVFNGTIPGNDLSRDGVIGANSTGIIYLTGQMISWLPDYFRNAVHIDYEGGNGDDEVFARKVAVSIDKTQKDITLFGTGGLWQDGDINFMNGDEIWYRLVYGNYTSGVITNVIIQDTFTTGFVYGGQYSIPDVGSPTQNGNTIIWNVGDLQPGQTGEIIITGNLYSDNGYPVYLNTGFILYDGGSGNDEVDAIPYGDLLFHKLQRNWTINSGGDFTHDTIIVSSGDIVEYRLYFENPTQENVIFTILDTIPNGFTPTNWNIEPIGTNGTFPILRPATNYDLSGNKYWSWNIDLPVGGTGLIYISGYISDIDNYKIFTNTGNITCMTEGGEYCGENEDDVVAMTAQFEFHKYVSSNPVANGENVTFRLCFDNNGANNMNAYTITDYLPITMEYLGNVRYLASGEILSGDLNQAPTITTTNSGYTIYEWSCGQAGGQLNNINGLCPFPAGTGGNACILFDARPKY